MQHSFLFKLSSYFVDKIVYQSQSLHNSELKVVLSNGKYLLNSGRANYSFGNLHRAFQEAFRICKLKKKPIKKVLILGFGAGSVAHILQKELRLNCRIKGVEIDEEVVYLAKEYFGFSELTDCTISISDAMLFVQKEKDKYDLITVDIFDEMNVPAEIQSMYFLQMLYERLNDMGVLIFNFIVENSKHEQELETLENNFFEIFSQVKTINIMQGNRMLLAEKSA